MSLFHNRFHYTEPERFSAEETRRRRVAALLEKERKALEVDPTRLSPANKFHLNKLKEFEDKFGKEVSDRLKHVRLEDSAAKDRSMSRLFQLLQRRSALQQRARQERASNAFKKDQKLFVDRAFGFDNRRAKKVFVNALGKHLLRGFTKTRLGLVPCIDRITRREVLFAKGHGGRGHRSPHHKGPLSHIGC